MIRIIDVQPSQEILICDSLKTLELHTEIFGPSDARSIRVCKRTVVGVIRHFWTADEEDVKDLAITTISYDSATNVWRCTISRENPFFDTFITAIKTLAESISILVYKV